LGIIDGCEFAEAYGFPSSTSRIIERIPKGTVVSIVTQKGRFTKVRYHICKGSDCVKDSIGWVESSKVHEYTPQKQTKNYASQTFPYYRYFGYGSCNVTPDPPNGRGYFSLHPFAWIKVLGENGWDYKIEYSLDQIYPPLDSDQDQSEAYLMSYLGNTETGWVDKWCMDL